MGKLLIKKKQFNQALNFFQTLLKNDPNNLRINFQMGKIFYELNDLHKSNKYFEKCKNINSKNPNVLFNYALVLQNLGRIEEAKKEYINLLSINPNDVKAYYGLSKININYINSKLYQNLKRLSKNEDISFYEKSLIYFIFSKIEKNKQNFESEINYLKKSHQLCEKANQIFNYQSNFYYKNIISRYFNKISYEEENAEIDEFTNNNHIFIIGLPRSGSSLVETIITHNTNEIVSVGEFHAINTSILEQLGNLIYSKSFDYKNFVFKINKKNFQNSLFQKYNNFEKKTYLDKSLENFFNIDIILKFFPNAKFVHTFRNFNDAVIGIYQTMLPELSWSHSIKNIIWYINLYNDTINYFKKKYPDKILDVELEKLTFEKEIETKKILRFCEINYKKNYLDFEKNPKLFNKTNSFLQVREKIKNNDKNKYKRYYNLLNNFNI